MELDTAIKFFEEGMHKNLCKHQEFVLMHDEDGAFYHARLAEEHTQMAEWLKELKAYKEQQPCKDAISRKAAVAQLHHNKTGETYESIEALMAEGENYDIEYSLWVPIREEMPDEELPEDFQRVLITITNYYGDKVVRVAEYYKRRKTFRVKENTNEWGAGEKGLLAWMPLPEPYKAESEGKN